MSPLLTRPSLAHRGLVLLLVVLCACLVTGATGASLWLRTTADDLGRKVFASDFTRSQVKLDYLEVPVERVPADGARRVDQALPPAIGQAVGPPRHSVSSPEMLPKTLPESTGLPGFMTVASLPGLDGLVEIESGRLPRPGPVEVSQASLPADVLPAWRKAVDYYRLGPGRLRPVPVVEVILEISGARALEVGAGSWIQLDAKGFSYLSNEPALLHVVGTYRAAEPYPSPLDDIDSGRRAHIDPTPQFAFVRAAALAADEATVLRATWVTESNLRWTFDPSDTPSVEQADALVDQARQLELQTWPQMARAVDARAQTGLGDLAQQVVTQRDTSDGMSLLALTGLAAGGFAVLLAAALLLAGRRDEQTEVVRARGASGRWLTVQRGVEAVLITLPGVAIAGALALTSGDEGLLGDAFAAGLVTAGVCVVLVTAAQAAPRASGDSVLRVVLRDAAQLVVVVLAIAVGVVVWRRGALDSLDALTLLAAPLLGAAAAVLVVRLLQLLLTGLRQLVRRTRPATGVVGLGEAAAISRRITVATAAVVLGLATAVLALTTSDTLRTGAERTGWEQVGADLVVQSPGLQDDAVEEIRSLPGTEAVAPVFVGETSSLSTAEGVKTIRLLAFDRRAMQKVVTGSPLPVDLPTSSADQVNALASPDLLLDDGKATLRYGSSVVPVHVVGRLERVPGVTTGESFLAVDAAVLSQATDRNLTDYGSVLVKGTPDPAAVRQIVQARNPLGEVLVRSEVTDIHLDTPVVTRTRALMDGAAVAAGLVALFAVVFIVTLGAPVRRRTGTLLTALGADGRQTRRIAGLGVAPLVAGACLAALGCGTALVLLADHGLDVASLIGTESPLAVRPTSASAVGLAAGCLLLVAVAALTASRRTRHLDPTDRTGTEHR